MTRKEVLERLKARFADAEVVEPNGEPYAVVGREKFLEVCRWLKETPDLDFDFCASVSGVDDTKDFWSVYHLYSTRRNHRTVVKVKLDRERPAVPSVCGLWPGANWHEREAYDMYGIEYEGHPDLRRILLPEDWPGFPLRKDYEFPDHYQGIPLK